MGDSNVNYNYFKIIDDHGNIVGVGAVEKGSDNEATFIDALIDHGLTPIKITKKEYDDYNEGDEVRNF